MRVGLNLATRPFETHRRFLAGSGVAIFVAAIVFLALGWHVYLARKANAEMRAKSEAILLQVQQLEQQRTELERFFGKPENARLHDRAAYINNLIDERSFNWTLMFMDLERMLPAGVRVVSILPSQDKGTAKVAFIIGATNDESKLKFLKALEDSKSFTNVVLTGEHRPSGANSVDQVVLDLTAEYKRS
ncbi:MAG TPA: hypothetical protein VJN93_05045 [Candidatus Acidoferrum sp.]|nr:hypothetical protein [Candidatus Acidoferrum sp.]